MLSSSSSRRWWKVCARVALYGGAALAVVAIIRYPAVFVRVARGVQRTIAGADERTIADVLAEHEARVAAKTRPFLEGAGASWPPSVLHLVAFKHERVLEVWAGDVDGALVRVATLPVLAASGALGPKRVEGDAQVPEGVYALPTLNPNSRFHLSILVDYPNDDDVARSTLPRAQMGGEIYVHGSNVSAGCLALGDRAIEDVFTLAALVPSAYRRIVIAPIDFRRPADTSTSQLPDEPALYAMLASTLSRYPLDGAQRR